MTNFFRRIKPESPVLRNNYFIQVDNNLAWSSSIGPEDSEGIGWFTAEKNKAIEHHYFRSERQSLRRCVFHLLSSPISLIFNIFPLLPFALISLLTSLSLPKTGAVVFTIRTYFHPITSIAQEPYVPGRLASAIRSWGNDVSRYKGRERYGEVLLEYLDGRHRVQVEGGLEEDGEGEGGYAL